MSTLTRPKRKTALTCAEIYDQALYYAKGKALPPDVLRPYHTDQWPAGHLELLERYRAWLESGGASPYTVRLIYIAMAGHVLGLNLKPHTQFDLDADLQRAMMYVRAKQLSAEWTDINRNALDKFRRFLLHERGMVENKKTLYDPVPHTQGLPDWLVDNLTRFQRIQQRNWREARIEENIRRFWCGHLRLWRFLCERYPIQELTDLKRAYFMDYIDWRLSNHASARGINGDLRSFHGFMAFLQEQGLPVPQALFRVPCLKEPDPLPKFLTDAQVRALRDDFEARVDAADNTAHRRDALLDRACFYLLWQSGLRRGEVEDLRLEDLDLDGRKLTVRRGKGMLDRTVFLTESVVRALKAYLPARGIGPTEHVFLYRNQSISKDLIHGRLKACGARVGVGVYAHRLRHTWATQLLNAGCRITSIQKFLGHKRLNTTLTYARAHDQTVADDYFAAMGSVERRMDLLGEGEPELLTLAEQLAQPLVNDTVRLEIALRMRQVLERASPIENGRTLWEHPPPSPVSVG